MPGVPLTVLEIAGGPAAAFGGMLLSALGAEVIRVERPGGRSFATRPTAGVDAPTAAYLGRGKRSLALDLRRRAGAAAFVELACRADAVIEDLGTGGLGRLDLSARRLRRTHPTLTVVRIAPFGHSGPRAGWAASELVLQAMGGIPFSTGFENEAGLRVAGLPVHFIAGIHAATAVFAAALGARLGNERGAEIAVSMEEAYLHHWVRHIQQWAYSGHRMVREPRSNGRQGFPHTVRAADGWLYVLALNAGWEEFAAFLGLDEFTTDAWSDPGVRASRWAEIEPSYRASIASRPRNEWFAGAAEHGYTFAPIHDMLQLASVAQFLTRGAFTPLEVDGELVPVPGLPWRTTGGVPAAAGAPAPGEHTREVLAGAGFDPGHIDALLRAGVAEQCDQGGMP